MILKIIKKNWDLQENIDMIKGILENIDIDIGC